MKIIRYVFTLIMVLVLFFTQFSSDDVNARINDNFGESIFFPPQDIISQSQSGTKNFDCSTVIDVPPTECEALVAFYESTNGDNWWSNDNWLISSTISD